MYIFTLFSLTLEIFSQATKGQLHLTRGFVWVECLPFQRFFAMHKLRTAEGMLDFVKNAETASFSPYKFASIFKSKSILHTM